MSPRANSTPLTAAPPPDRRAQLRTLSRQLEGVFLNQLFQAMRASVPQDGVIASNPGQQMFTQMLDERLAGEASQRMSSGLSEALYRQLAARLGPETETRRPARPQTWRPARRPDGWTRTSARRWRWAN